MTVHLCFHGIGESRLEREPGESRYWVTEGLFRRVLDYVAAQPDVELSFDDGNASDVEVALPALRERGLTATYFVLAGRLQDSASLGPADLRELREEGMRIGSHGWAHVPWRGLDATDEEREFYSARQGWRTRAAGPWRPRPCRSDDMTVDAYAPSNAPATRRSTRATDSRHVRTPGSRRDTASRRRTRSSRLRRLSMAGLGEAFSAAVW